MTNTPLSDLDLQAQAVLWVVRVNDPEFLDWEAFEAWLSADATHATAYHEAVDAEQTITELLSKAPVAPTAYISAPLRPTGRGPWRRSAPWIAGALAASLVLITTFGMLRPREQVMYQTGPGGHRDIVLADGSHIALNGDTQLTVSANDPRAIRLERGEALFTVRHDPAHPFSVTVGDATVTDVGTVFDVVRNPSATHVAVAQGTVIWNPARMAVRLDAGQGLHAQDGGAAVRLTAIDASAVGGWSTGQLSYDGMPLSAVAQDVARTLGVTVSVSPDVAGRPVRGILRLQGGAGMVLPRLAALLGLRAEHDGATWRLTASP